MKLIILAAAFAVIVGAAPARADNFNFTFAGTGIFSGTVTGEVFGLTNGSSTPTEVKVFSSTNPTEPYPLDFTVANSAFSGTITDASGTVTADAFSLYQSSTGLGLGLDVSELNYFGKVGGSNSSGVQNEGGFAGATFTLARAVSAAPEPASWALMLCGVGMLGAMMRVANARRREDECRSIATA